MDDMKEEDILIEARERFKFCVDGEAENRNLALQDLEFIEGEQWPTQVYNDRTKEGRPCLVINKLPAYVRQVVNDIRQVRPSVKCRPVDDISDPESAEILQGMIRAIEQDSSAESAYDWAAEYAVKCGIGFWRIRTDYADDDSFEQVIKIERIRNPFSVYVDPAAEAQDASDARFMFIVEKMSKDAFKKKYPDVDMTSWNDSSEGDDGWWFGEDYVRIAEYWSVEVKKKTITLLRDKDTGQTSIVDGRVELTPEDPWEEIATREAEDREVKQRILTGAVVLDESEWPGKNIPIIRVYGREVDIEGRTYYKGMVRDLKDPQRMYNYFRSAETERYALYSKAPWIGPEGAFEDPRWRTANKKNHAFLEYKGTISPQRDPPPDVSPASVHQIQIAAEEMKAVSGIYDAGIGARSNEVSGIAIDSRRGESDVSNFDFVDNLARAMTYSGKILVDLIPKIYSGQRMVRILKPDGSDEQVQINAPFLNQKMQQKNYNIENGRYDIAVDIGPSYATKREEAVNSMLEVLKAFPQAASVMGDLLAKNMDWPEADEISKRLKLLLPPEILQDENPAIKQALMMKDQEIAQLNQQMQMLISEAQRMGVELQNRDQKSQLDQADLMRKIKKDLMDHIEGMTKLEIDANKDLGPSGVYLP
jgi:hypothetical protein